MRLGWSRVAAREWVGGWALKPGPGDSLTLILSKGTWTESWYGAWGWMHGLSPMPPLVAVIAWETARFVPSLYFLSCKMGERCSLLVLPEKKDWC